MANDTARAVKFFHELDTFADRFAKREFGCRMDVPHGGPSPEHGFRGAVIHYTADQDPLRVVRWFRDPSSHVSAHLVVCDRRLDIHEELSRGLPLVQALPVTVIQCRDPGEGAWHAKWANESCYGIELVSAGLLRKNSDGCLCTWHPRDRSAGNWTSPWVSSDKDPVRLYGQTWDPFTPEQILATITALRHLRHFGMRFATLEPEWILGHDLVQQDKLDPGPTFPIHGVRDAVFDRFPVTDREWWIWYETDPLAGQAWRDRAVTRLVRAQAVATETRRDLTVDIAWSRAWAAWSRIAEDPCTFQEYWVKLGLYILGYAVSLYLDFERARPCRLTEQDLQSVRIFQRMAGCVVDGYPGPRTCTAMLERLSRRFASPRDERKSYGQYWP
jgi:N-acetyl-anhydromuramyl-L-alanine amidase AmpD